MQQLKIYTDGSHFKGSDRVGYGICFEYNGKMYTQSSKVNVAAFRKRYDGVTVSNPTAELLASVKVLEIFCNNSVTDHELTIYSDYNGVQNWLNSNWKASKPYIADIVKRGIECMKILRKNGNIVKLEWIKGHSGHSMNEQADKLAKSMREYSNLQDYFETLYISV